MALKTENLKQKILNVNNDITLFTIFQTLQKKNRNASVM